MSNGLNPVSPELFESIFRQVNREIWIVTSASARADSGVSRAGLVATWVTQASIDPRRPIVSLGIAPNHVTGKLIRESQRFALHLLRPDQAALALQFAIGSSDQIDKFAGLSWKPGPLGMPRLLEAAVWLEGSVIHCLDGGDRLYFWGCIHHAELASEGQVLTERDLFAAASPEQLRKLKENREHDCEVHRPMFEHWLAASARSDG